MKTLSACRFSNAYWISRKFPSASCHPGVAEKKHRLDGSALVTVAAQSLDRRARERAPSMERISSGPGAVRDTRELETSKLAVHCLVPFIFHSSLGTPVAS